MNIRDVLRFVLAASAASGLGACGAGAVDAQDGPAPRTASATRAVEAPAADAMERVDIVDPAGFGRPVVAAVAQIPAGWHTQGGIGWNRATDCVSNQLQIAWSARSPDGTQAVEILPGFNWQVQDTQIAMNPCPAMPFASTRDFLHAVVQQHRPGARVLQYRDRPDLAGSAAAPSNPNVQVHQDAGQVLIAYAQDGGEVRELLGATVVFSNAGGNIVAGTAMVFAQRAPADAFDGALGERIAASIRPDPQWLAMMREAGNRAVAQYSGRQRAAIDDWHSRRMAAISARGAAERAAIVANTQREVAAINAQTHADTMATNDRMQAQRLEAIGEYSRYRGTDGGEVRASIHGGARVLQMQDGEALGTDDPYFNPAGSTELERVP